MKGTMMLLVWLACCPLCFVFAGQRNRPRGMWAGLGLILGPLALLLLLMMPMAAPQTPVARPRVSTR